MSNSSYANTGDRAHMATVLGYYAVHCTRCYPGSKDTNVGYMDEVFEDHMPLLVHPCNRIRAHVLFRLVKIHVTYHTHTHTLSPCDRASGCRSLKVVFITNFLSATGSWCADLLSQRTTISQSGVCCCIICVRVPSTAGRSQHPAFRL